MRTPVRLLRELGFAGFATFQLVVGGNVAAALIHPLFVAAVIIAFVTDAPIVGATARRRHWSGCSGRRSARAT